MISGYYTALERTLFLDKIDDASLKAWEANIKVHKRGLELIKPGVKCSEICHELNDLFRTIWLSSIQNIWIWPLIWQCYLIFMERESGLELREDIEYSIRGEHGYFNGANDNDT